MLKLPKLFFIFVLLAHFFMLFWYLSPDNPISHQYKYYIYKYVNPLFTQSWNLFAPNPVNSDQIITIRFIEYSGHNANITPYLDLTTPIETERKKTFLNANQRISKFLSGNNQSLLDLSRKSFKIIEDNKSLKNDSVTLGKQLMSLYSNSDGRKLLSAYSTVVYNNYRYINGSNKYDSVYFQCRIINREFPRFSKRHLNPRDDKNCQITHVEFPPVSLIHKI